MRRTVILSLTLLLALAPSAVHSQGTYFDALVAAEPDLKRLGASATTLSEGVSPTALAEMDAAAIALVVTLDAHAPEPCWAGWWSDVRSMALLMGEVPEAVRALDEERAKGLLVGAMFLLQLSNETLAEASC